MKSITAVAVLVLHAGLASVFSPLCAAQNPLAALENEAKEKAAEAALTKVLNENLPLTLDAKDVYPTVTTLPGGPFSPTPLKLTADQLDQPLPPGDYTINTLDFCSQYSVHQPGAGIAYVLGPYEGKAAGAIGALIWRGTVQYGIAPQSLQGVSWAIQSGLTYDQMPKSYQAIVDQVIPDFKSEITGDFVTNLENTYNDLAKAASLPPLDTMLGKLGGPGQLALDAERQRQILTAQNTSDQIKEQTLFQGQESGIYSPVKAENGPWTERVAGQVYMKLLIAGGNMATNNVMQIRVIPAPTANARVETGGPRLVRTAYGEPQVAPAVDNAPITVASMMEGTLGYSQGQGAQALGQVPVVSPGGPAQTPPPVEANNAPPAGTPNPGNGTPAPANPAPTTPPTAGQPGQGPSGSGQSASTRKAIFTFVSCSGALTSQDLFDAYTSLYTGSSTFESRMDSITDDVFVMVVDGGAGFGLRFQNAAARGYANLDGNNVGSGLDAPPATDYAFTFVQKNAPAAASPATSSSEPAATIMVVISAQALQNNSYPTGYRPPDPSGSIVSPSVLEKSKVSVQQPLAYELGQNAWGFSQDPKYTEKPNEDDTNTIMGELGRSANQNFVPNATENTKTHQIMSGAAFFDSALPANQVLDFAHDKFIVGSTVDPDKAPKIYSNGALSQLELCSGQ
jgi:hypothetical protein